jgi:hypothetical protein
MVYRQVFDKLQVTSLTAEQHERHGPYWFIVSNGSMSHTAFETRAGLDRWMTERGLTLENDLPDAGTWGTTRVLYGYAAESHGEFLSGDPRDGMGPGGFYALQPVLMTAAMSNAQYTLALVTQDGAYGVRTVHTLNPNVRDRVVFDYWRMREAQPR